MIPSQADRLLHRKGAALAREEFDGRTRSDSRDRKRDVEQIKEATTAPEWTKGALLSGKVSQGCAQRRWEVPATWS